MSTNYDTTNRRGATLAARDLAAELTGHGLKLPTEVTTAASLVTALIARRAPGEGDMRRAAVSALLEDPDADVTALVTAELCSTTVGNVLAQARDDAGSTLRAALLTHADELVAQLRERIFAPAVGVLTTVAAIPAGDTVATLLRAGRADDAQALADAEASAPVAASRVATCYRLRARLYGGARSGVDALACSTWRRPDVPDRPALGGLSGLDRWVAGIRAGGELWLPTFGEAEDASRAAERQADDHARAAAERIVADAQDRRATRRRTGRVGAA